MMQQEHKSHPETKLPMTNSPCADTPLLKQQQKLAQSQGATQRWQMLMIATACNADDPNLMQGMQKKCKEGETTRLQVCYHNKQTNKQSFICHPPQMQPYLGTLLAYLQRHPPHMWQTLGGGP